METWGKCAGQAEINYRMYDRWWVIDEGGDRIAECDTEADADAIIRDHELAALAEEMRECLVDMLNHYDAIVTGSAEGQS